MATSPVEYISGDSFERLCGNSLTLNDTYLDFNIVLEERAYNRDWFFVKIDYLKLFKEKYRPTRPYCLVTGKSDYAIDKNWFDFIDSDNLALWYSTNVNYVHGKLRSIPLGVNNEWWFQKYGKDFADHSLLYANFNVKNNTAERLECLRYAGVELTGSGLESKGFRPYLQELKRSYFCLAPNGNGIDTHRLWESLYVGTVPIVTRTINSVQYEGKLPIVFLDSWAELDTDTLTPERYHAMMAGFDFSRYKPVDFLPFP